MLNKNFYYHTFQHLYLLDKYYSRPSQNQSGAYREAFKLRLVICSVMKTKIEMHCDNHLFALSVIHFVKAFHLEIYFKSNSSVLELVPFF